MGDSKLTKNAAIHSFFSGFGLPAYPATSVPTSGDEKPEFPYITYTVSTDYGLNRTAVNASIWYRSESWVDINAKVDFISREVGEGCVIGCDDGAIIIRKGTPWAQPMGDDADNMVKRKILNFEFLFATTY